MTMETRNHPENKEVVIGYFAQYDDAQRAIDDLLAEGFQARQIGAAFHSRDAASSATGLTGTGEVGSKAVRDAVNSNTIGSGPASDTRAVTPAGLSTGSGSVISGASKPGPIPGSEIPHHHKNDIASGTETRATTPLPATGGLHESHNEESWWEKLKHIFNSDTARKAPDKETATSTSMNFGTGEGHLATYPDTYEYAYSGSAFESAFSGMGVPRSHAQSLAGELSRGGAIVSVAATGQVAAAERVLERNHGRIRYEAVQAGSRAEDGSPTGQVRVFGEVSRVYPGYLPSTGSTSRKAS